MSIGEDDLEADPSAVLHWFDFLCPYCYVGQSRDTVLRGLGLRVVDLPFQAHPEIPPGGIAMGPRTGPMYQALEREAEELGLELNWPSRLPDTRLALAASEWVRRHASDRSVQFNALLFASHFARGEDLGDPECIAANASSIGIGAEGLFDALVDGTADADVAQVRRSGIRHGVQGTPAWLIQGHLISGLRSIAQFTHLAQSAIDAT
jgi:predicted DsbA family dithiol-disulfide isomerase